MMMDLEKREKLGGAVNNGIGGYEDGDDTSSSMRTVETILRLTPVGLCVAALVIMLKNSQSNDYGSISYSDIGSFKYLVHANGICAGYSLLTAVVSAVPRRTISRAWTFFCLDQLLTYLILAAAAGSTEVVYLAYHGDSDTTWSKACDSFGGFCRKARASVVVTFLVVVCYTILSIVSSYRLFSRFDAPSSTTTATSTDK